MIRSRQELKCILPLKTWNQTESDACLYSIKTSPSQAERCCLSELKCEWRTFRTVRETEQWGGRFWKWGGRHTKSTYKLFSNSWMMPVMNMCGRHYKKLSKNQLLEAWKGIGGNLVETELNPSLLESLGISNSKASYQNSIRARPRE